MLVIHLLQQFTTLAGVTTSVGIIGKHLTNWKKCDGFKPYINITIESQANKKSDTPKQTWFTVVYYAATWHTFRCTLEKIKKYPSKKNSLYFEKWDFLTLILIFFYILLYFRKRKFWKQSLYFRKPKPCKSFLYFGK